MKTRTILTLCLIAFASTGCQTNWQYPARIPAVLSGDEDFVTALQAGFDRDYGDNEVAKQLGSGTCSLLLSERKPLATFCDFEGKKKPILHTAKEMTEFIVPIAAEKKSATWFAWRDDKGVFCVAFNCLSGEYEKSVINLITDEPELSGGSVDWSAWSTYFLGSFKSTWLKSGSADLTIIKMGEKDSTKLPKKLEWLQKLGIINDVIM